MTELTDVNPGVFHLDAVFWLVYVAARLGLRLRYVEALARSTVASEMTKNAELTLAMLLRTYRRDVARNTTEEQVVDLPVELHSTYIGHPGSTTHATHLRLGPEARSPRIGTAEHADDAICLVFTPRNAVYDHAHELVEFFDDLGYRAAVHVDDGAFQALEAVPSGRLS